jgi:hypothetical protein
MYRPQENPLKHARCVRENCEQLGVREGEKYCRIAFLYAHVPTYSRPECPKNSSYNPSTERCECFAGFYSLSPSSGQCRKSHRATRECSLARVQDRYLFPPGKTGFCSDDFLENPTDLGEEGLELCKQKFGAKSRYAEASKSCFCKTGYSLHVTETGLQCLETSNSEDTEMENTSRESEEWTLSIVKNKRKTFDFIRVEWKLTNIPNKSKIHGYAISVQQTESNTGVFAQSLNRYVDHIYFQAKKDTSYRITIKAVDRYGKILFSKTEGI